MEKTVTVLFLHCLQICVFSYSLLSVLKANIAHVVKFKNDTNVTLNSYLLDNQLFGKYEYGSFSQFALLMEAF